MRTLLFGYRIFGYFKLAGALFSGAAIFGMMLFIVADVVSRNWLSGSIPGGYEVAQKYFMPLSVFPALAYVYASGVLPKIDLVMHRLARGIQNVITYALLLLEIVAFSLVAYYTWEYAMSGMQRGVAFPAGGSLYVVWPLFFLVPLGFGAVIIETLFSLVRNLIGEEVSLSMETTPDLNAI